MSADEQKPTHRMTIHLEGGMNVTTDLHDPLVARSNIERLVDQYYSPSWFSRRPKWAFIAGQPYVCFPIERMVMFSIAEIPQ